MSTFAPINKNYIVDQDGSVPFTSPHVINLTSPNASINWQFKWDSGVSGKITWFASIFSEPFVWENLISCEAVELTIDSSAESSIISLPENWLTVGFIKFEFVPLAGSSGLISAAIRSVPV